MPRTFIVFMLTQILSLIGSRMTAVAIGIRIFADTGDSGPVLIASFFAELPLMVAGSLTGILADTWDKRRVIVLGDAGQAAATLVLLLSVISGAFELWHLYAVVLVQGVFSALQAPAAEAAITLLVPPPQRDRANGIRQIGFPLAGVVAPVLAGAVYALAGFEAVVGLDLLTFLIAVAVVARLTIPVPPAASDADAPAEPFWRELLGGWLFLVQRRALLALVVYLAFVFFLINGPLDLAIPYLFTLSGDEALVGVLLGAMSGGALAGALAIALWGDVRHRIAVLLAGYLLHGLLLIVYGVVRHPLLLGLSLFAAMMPLPFNGALFSTLLQNKTPPAIQGRVFAITGQVFTLTTPFSFLITAFLVDEVLEPAVGTRGWRNVAPLVGSAPGAGMGLVLVTVGALIVVATLAVWAHPRIRHLERDLPDAAVGE